MYKKRSLFDTVLKNLHRKEYLIITGARQVGKTVLLRQLYQQLEGERTKVFMLNLEDPEIRFALDSHPGNLFRFVERPLSVATKPVAVQDRVYVLVDEIQYLKDPSNFLKFMYDSYQERLKIVATGSSAFYLDRKFKDSLAGRKRLLHLKTLSFEEFLLFREDRELLKELELIRQRHEYLSLSFNELMERLGEYLVFGGYPAVVLEQQVEEKKLALAEIRNSFVKRDISEAGIRHEDVFYRLMILLAGQAGNLVNRNELSRSLWVDNKTIAEYLSVMARCHHIHMLPPFSRSLRNELTRMPKVYFLDNGMRNILLNRFWPLHQRDDTGALLENFVFNRLCEKYNAEELKYWRTAAGHEIDFVVSDPGIGLLALEVKFDARRKMTRSFEKFLGLYPSAQTGTIAYHHDDQSIPVLKL